MTSDLDNYDFELERRWMREEARKVDARRRALRRRVFYERHRRGLLIGGFVAWSVATVALGILIGVN